MEKNNRHGNGHTRGTFHAPSVVAGEGWMDAAIDIKESHNRAARRNHQKTSEVARSVLVLRTSPSM